MKNQPAGPSNKAVLKTKRHQPSDNYKKLIDSSLDVICSSDEAGNFVFVSAAAKQVWGYSPEELVGKRYIDFVAEEDRGSTMLEASRIKAGADITNFQNHYIRKDGTLVPMLWSAKWDSEEGLMYCVAKDSTEKKEAERKAKENDDHLKRAYKLSKIGWWEWDTQNNAYNGSDEVFEIYGLNKEEIPFISFEFYASLVHPEDLDNVMKAMYEMQTANYKEIEHRLIKPSGEIIYLLQCSNVERNEHGTIIRIHGTTKDITEKVELQKRVIEEKITTQKEIARAIIDTQEKERSEIGKELHDNVNQVLTTVKLYIENIRNYPELRDSFIDKSIVLAQRAINEIRFLAKQLVTPVMKDLGFEATIAELVEHYQSLNKFTINLEFDIREHTMEQGMRLTIYRIIQEQLNNVVKYAKASKVDITIVYKKGTVRVKVADNGIGFDTSKHVHGLGLNNIKNRAEVYKGKLQLKSSPGKGCSLFINFPITTSNEQSTLMVATNSEGLSQIN